MQQDSITAIKNISINEPFFQGHFPLSPIVPGVLLIEMMAQTMSVLGYHLKENVQKTKAYYYVLVSIDNAKFKLPVVPGDQLHIQVMHPRQRGRFLKCHAVITVEGKMICQADLMGACQTNNIQLLNK